MISIAPYLAPFSGIGLRKVKLLRPLSRMPEGILRPSKFSSETVAKTSGQSMKSVNIKLEPAEKKAVLASRFEAFSGLKMSGSTVPGGVSAGFFPAFSAVLSFFRACLSASFSASSSLNTSRTRAWASAVEKSNHWAQLPERN